MARAKESKKTTRKKKDEEIIEDAQITEETPKEEQKEEAPEQEEKKRKPRQIVGFGSVSSIKKFLLDGSSDEESAVKNIAKKCMDDFAVKCVRILESFSEAPSSVYTYVMFLERFAWLQQDDITTKEGTRELVVTSKEGEYAINRIYDLYFADNSHYKGVQKLEGLFDPDLMSDSQTAKKKIAKMFGEGLFPNIMFWYNYNEELNIWQYAYSISTPKTEGRQDHGNEK